MHLTEVVNNERYFSACIDIFGELFGNFKTLDINHSTGDNVVENLPLDDDFFVVGYTSTSLRRVEMFIHLYQVLYETSITNKFKW